MSPQLGLSSPRLSGSRFCIPRPAPVCCCWSCSLCYWQASDSGSAPQLFSGRKTKSSYTRRPFHFRHFLLPPWNVRRSSHHPVSHPCSTKVATRLHKLVLPAHSQLGQGMPGRPQSVCSSGKCHRTVLCSVENSRVPHLLRQRVERYAGNFAPGKLRGIAACDLVHICPAYRDVHRLRNVNKRTGQFFVRWPTLPEVLVPTCLC